MPDLFAISDLHLPGGTGKTMDRFGPEWQDHAARIAAVWDTTVQADDIVLLPGDLSWALRLEDMQDDFAWLAGRPGTKIMIKGNHDLWWGSVSKVRQALPPDTHVIQNDSFTYKNIGFAGTRYWIDPAVSWPAGNRAVETAAAAESTADNKKILQRELHRLELSLQSLPESAQARIALVHFPPVGPEGEALRAAALLARFGVTVCVFGHLHGLGPEYTARQTIKSAGIMFYPVSADFTGFTLRRIPVSPAFS